MVDLRSRLADRNIELVLNDVARAHVARQGFDPVYGARPLKRYLQQELETRIAPALVAGEAADGATAHVEVGDGGLWLGGTDRESVGEGVEARGVGAFSTG